MNKGVTCRDCDHFRACLFCGYESSNCEIHGSLDVNQHERHPDTAAATCPDSVSYTHLTLPTIA